MIFFVIVGRLYEVVILASLRLSPAGYQVWLWIGHLIYCIQLTYMYLFGEISRVSHSLFFTMRFFGILLEEQWLGLCLCGSNLDIDRGSSWQNDCLCASCVCGYTFTCTLAGIDYGTPVQFSKQVLSCPWFSVEGVCLVDYFNWQIYGHGIALYSFPCRHLSMYI